MSNDPFSSTASTSGTRPQPNHSGQAIAASRADIARLTLRLRAAQREAAEATSASATLDPDAARADLHARLEPLIEQRRRLLADELERVRSESLHEIDTARRQAADLLERALSARPAPSAPSVPPVPPAQAVPPNPPAPAAPEAGGAVSPPLASFATPTPRSAPFEPVVEPEPVADPLWAVHDVPRHAPQQPRQEPTYRSTQGEQMYRPQPEFSPLPAVQPPPTVLIDAEAFARVFANMVAQVIEERSPHPQSIVVPMPTQMAPAKQGFWTHARHIDVMLLGLTMVIVLVILAAWLV
jgi:hypothetical protein